jgi:hypothetical protein
LIGKTSAEHGTVDVATTGCLDLRDKTSVMDTVALVQEAKVVVTNDSSPLHMAASGDAWILYAATCKHPDFLTYWRHGTWGWRMENMGRGGIWDTYSFLPNNSKMIEVDQCDEATLLKWLPEPQVMVERALFRLKNPTANI